MLVRVPRSWALLAIILIVISVNALVPSGASGGALVRWLAAALAVIFGSIASIALHELAHHLLARRFGEGLRFFDLSLFGALSDVAFPPKSPRVEVRIALAGPLASAALGLLTGTGWYLLQTYPLVSGAFGTLSLINLTIAVGALLPGLPLDGGRILRAFVWYLTDDLIFATNMVHVYGYVIGLGALMGGLLFLALGEPFAIWGAWTLLTFWVVNPAGEAGSRRTIMRETGSRVLIDEAGLAFSRRIQADRTIDDALDDLLSATASGPILVQENGNVVGIVSVEQVRHVPRMVWDRTTIREIQVPLTYHPRVQHDARILELLDLFDHDDVKLVVIEMRGHIVGAVDRPATHARLEEFLRQDSMAQDHHRT